MLEIALNANYSKDSILATRVRLLYAFILIHIMGLGDKPTLLVKLPNLATTYNQFSNYKYEQSNIIS